MPKILSYQDFIILIYTNDHEPSHCHIKLNGYAGIKVFLDDFRIQLSKGGKSPNSKKLRTILEQVENHIELLRQEWNKYHENQKDK